MLQFPAGVRFVEPLWESFMFHIGQHTQYEEVKRAKTLCDIFITVGVSNFLTRAFFEMFTALCSRWVHLQE